MQAYKKILSISTAGKLTAIFVLAILFYSTAFYFLGVLSILLLPFVALIGLLAFSFAVFTAVKQRSRNAISVLIAICIAWIVLPFFPTREIGMYSRFWVERSKYETAVAEMAQGQQPGCLLGGICEIDPGPPIKLAFSWGGIIDNWVGVIYDPTEEITNIERHKAIFGGDLIWCRHITSSYFICGFT